MSKPVSHVPVFVIPQTVARQAALSMEFSRHLYQSRLPFPSSGDLPDPGIEPASPALLADSLPDELPRKPQWKLPGKTRGLGYGNKARKRLKD